MSVAIIHACARRQRELHIELQLPSNFLRRDELVQQAAADLYELVCNYFEVSEWERQLIKDTVDIFRPSSTPPSMESEKLLTARASRGDQRMTYAETLVKTFRSWTRTEGHLWSEATISTRLGLAVVTFGISQTPRAYVENLVDDRVLEILEGMRKTATTNSSLFCRLRGFAIYEGDRVHILKPLSLRHWTDTAALNDADEILTRMLEEAE